MSHAAQAGIAGARLASAYSLRRSRPHRRGHRRGDERHPATRSTARKSRALPRSAASWWDPAGSFRPLHQLNPARLDFIRRAAARAFRPRLALAARRSTGCACADIGCGGGLVAEPMARLGFAVTGDRRRRGGDRRRPRPCRGERARRSTTGVATVEALADGGRALRRRAGARNRRARRRPRWFLAACGALVKPGGAFIGATLNRTPQSFALAIVGAEYLLGWLPRGTHDWQQVSCARRNSCSACAGPGSTRRGLRGMRYRLLSGDWASTDDLSVNYMVTAVRR